MTAYDRYRWQQGGQISLFGLSRIGEFGPEAITLVTNEFDAIVQWYDGSEYPTVAIPGANAWEEERDAPHLERFEKIHVVVPAGGSGRSTILDWLGRSAIKDRTFLVTLPEQFADLYSIYRDNPVDFAQRFQQLLDDAVAYDVGAQEEIREHRERSRHQAGRLINHPNILDAVVQTVHDELFVSEEDKLIKLVYLAMTSRILERIVSLIVKGSSATGKSYTVAQVLKLFPADARHEMTAMTERAMVNTHESLAHTMLVIYEAVGLGRGFAAYVVRSLLSEGRIRYKTARGTHTIPGPTGLIVTTTELALHAENETRCLSMTTDDSPDHTRSILQVQAQSQPGRRGIPSQAAWHAL